jgi:hypothetical protein
MDFTHRFNRANIDQLSHAPEFDIAVCAAAPGSMLLANKFPDRDLANLEILMMDLARVRTRRFVLISTIAVLADPAAGLNEASDHYQTTLAYGRNRRALEVFCEEHFENCLVLRLPALFGAGLQKNFIFDLLNPVPSMLTAARLEALIATTGETAGSRLASLYRLDPETELFTLDRARLNASSDRSLLDQAVEDAGFAAAGFHNHMTTYQYYDLSRLSSDIMRASEAGLRKLHAAAQPLRAARIYERLLGRSMPETQGRLYREDMHTLHAGLWGCGGPYLASADDVLDRLLEFFATERLSA